MSLSIKDQLYGDSQTSRAQGIKLKLITPSAEEAVTLEHMKDVLHIRNARSDVRLTRVIKASRFLVEKLSGKTLVNQTWTQIHDRTSRTITLAVAPVVSISSVKFYPNLDSTVQTTVVASKYFLAGDTVTTREGWEATRGVQGFEITFVAGFGATSALVAANGEAHSLLQATEMIAAYLYENPGDLIQVDAINAGGNDRAGMRSLPPEALLLIRSEFAWEL